MTNLSSQSVAAILAAVFLFPNLRAETVTNKTTKFILPPSIAERSKVTVEIPPAESIAIEEPGLRIELALPKAWAAPASGEVALAVHFHNPETFAQSEHARRGWKGPILIVHLGKTTPEYQAPFKDKERFGRLIKLTEAKLKEKGAPEKTRVTAVDISSYGAGYGAVREILEVPEYVKIIRRLVLCDSMYASYAKDAEGRRTRVPVTEHIDPWISFASAAARGEKTFVMTYSQIQPESYASTGECAAAIIGKIGGSIKAVELDSSAAANDLTCALFARGDTGNFHAWGYAGNDVTARMMHAWHLADIWKTLDTAGEP